MMLYSHNLPFLEHDALRDLPWSCTCINSSSCNTMHLSLQANIFFHSVALKIRMMILNTILTLCCYSTLLLLLLILSLPDSEISLSDAWYPKSIWLGSLWQLAIYNLQFCFEKPFTFLEQTSYTVIRNCHSHQSCKWKEDQITQISAPRKV